MRVDMYASRPHYASHMLPIWRALPRSMRGLMTGWNREDWWAKTDPPVVRSLDVVTMIAGAVDMQSRAGFGPFVYVEHGAGQTYPGDERSMLDPSYSGGAGHDDVVLYVAPSDTVAERWRARYPHVPVIVAGCPLLDPWHRGDRPFIAERKPTVAITFHWDCALVPETRSAFRHYEHELARCVELWRAQGFEIVGHGHPRVYDALTTTWAALDVRQVPLGWVYDHADVLVGDNTSALYEFASLGRDVVCMNAPWYRRDVEHGLRFWSHLPGLWVDDADRLIDVVSLLLSRDHGALAASDTMRRAAVAEAYSHCDGYAAWRAAAAIASLEDQRHEHRAGSTAGRVSA